MISWKNKFFEKKHILIILYATSKGTEFRLKYILMFNIMDCRSQIPKFENVKGAVNNDGALVIKNSLIIASQEFHMRTF